MKNHLDFDMFIKDNIKLFTELNMTESNIKEVFETEGSNIYDFAWHVFNRILSAIASTNDITETKRYHLFKETNFQMVLFQRRYENKKANHIWKELMKNELLERYYDDTGLVLDVEIIAVKDCCEYCNSFDGKIISIEKALNELPYNPNECKNSYGCRSTLGFRGKRDENGRLITKA